MVLRSSKRLSAARRPDRLASVTTRPLAYSEVCSDNLALASVSREALGQRKSEDKLILCGTSLVAQWLRLRAPNAGGPGFDPWSEN